MTAIRLMIMGRVPQDGYITTLLTRKAVEFLKETDRNTPFFISVT